MLWSNISSEFCPTSLDARQNPQRLPNIFYPVFKDAPMLLSTVRKSPHGPLQHPAASTTQDIQTTSTPLSCKGKFAETSSKLRSNPRLRPSWAIGEAMKTLRKAVIPVAGLGTRFLPATKAQPKEMLPLVDTPVIPYVVEEAIRSGIESLVMVTGRGKAAIENHFDVAFELEDTLRRRGRQEDLDLVQGISHLAQFAYVRQGEPLGLGHAVLCARHAVGDEPFALLLGDDVFDERDSALDALIAAYRITGKSVVGVQEVPLEIGRAHV